MSNESTPKLYKEILESIRLTLPVPFRPDSYDEISAAINKWAEDKQSFITKLVEQNDELRAKLKRADELRESAQAVTRKLQESDELPDLPEEIRLEYQGFVEDHLLSPIATLVQQGVEIHIEMKPTKI